MIKKLFSAIAAIALASALTIGVGAEDGSEQEDSSSVSVVQTNAANETEDFSYSEDGNWSYTMLNDLTIAVSGYYGEKTNVVVPETIDNFTVTAIGGGWYTDENGESVLYGNIHGVEYSDDGSIAKSQVYSPFSGNGKIFAITLPETVKYLGAISFKGCTSLKTVNLNNDIEIIGNSCFEGCTALEEITLPEGLKLCDQNMFSGCTALSTAEIPKNARIEASLFEGCTSLSSVTLPENYTYLPPSIFKDCASLKEIALSDTLESIGDSAFYGCSSLSEIAIPDTVKTIYNNAFYGCSSLSEVDMSENIEALGNNAFAGCAISELTLPETLLGIGKNAFGTDENGVVTDGFLLNCPSYSAAFDYAVKNGIACTAETVTAPLNSDVSGENGGPFAKRLSPEKALYILIFAAAALIAVIVLMIVNHIKAAAESEEE